MELWKQLCIKSPSRQTFSYQHLWCRQETITESMRTGNVEAFPPQDCVRTVEHRFGRAEATYLLSPGCISPWGLTLIPPFLLWNLWNLFSPGVANYPDWGHSATIRRHRTSVELLHECHVWSQRGYKMTMYCRATMSPHHL